MNEYPKINSENKLTLSAFEKVNTCVKACRILANMPTIPRCKQVKLPYQITMGITQDMNAATPNYPLYHTLICQARSMRSVMINNDWANSIFEPTNTVLANLIITLNPADIIASTKIITDCYHGWEFASENESNRLSLLNHLIIRFEEIYATSLNFGIRYKSVDFNTLLIEAVVFKNLIELDHYKHGQFDNMIMENEGLCINLYNAMVNQLEIEYCDLDDVLTQCFRTWSNFSGDYDYPVPNLDESLQNHEFYDQSKNKYVGEQGVLRMNLLNHIIEELKNPAALLRRVQNAADEIVKNEPTLKGVRYGNIDFSTLIAECKRFKRVMLREVEWEETYYDESYGICVNVSNIFHQMNGRDDATDNALSNVLRTAYLTWDQWSGDINYPVPSTEDGLTPKQCYDQSESLYEGRQLDCRLSLIEHLMCELSKGREFVELINHLIP